MRGNSQDYGKAAPDERGAPLPPLEFRRDKPPDPRFAFLLICRLGARLIPNNGRGRRNLAVAGSRGKAGPLYGEGFYWLSHVSSNQRAGVGRTSYAKFSKKSRDSAPSPPLKSHGALIQPPRRSVRDLPAQGDLRGATSGDEGGSRGRIGAARFSKRKICVC